MRRRLHVFAVLVAAAVVVGGCGSTRHVTRTISRTATTASRQSTTAAGSAPATSSATATAPATSSATATGPAPGSTGTATLTAGRSPRAIVDLAAGALARANGYAMRADLTQSHQHTVIALTTTGPGTYDASVDTGSRDTAIVRIGQATYLRGNRAFWAAQAGHSASARARAAALANRWITVPPANRRSVNGSLGTLAPTTLARCLREDHGRLTIAGHTTIAGRRAIVIRDAGNAPGSTPSTIAVAAAGTPYPLRYVATGDARRGGRVDVCNTGKGGGAQGTIALSQFGDIGPIAKPTGASSGGGATT